LAAAFPRDFDELRPGTPLGPYVLLLPVGAGGMARVWAARHRATGGVVALKMLLPELAENPSFQQMFSDEARIASRVRHPNVCATYDLGHHDGVTTMTMEWVDGPSLMRIIRPGPEDRDDPPYVPIHPRLGARIVADACAGLHAAHDLVADDGRPLAVVHRDVSPHNLLLTSTGQVKVTDFGIAKALGKSHMTVTGQLKGKLAYMAPEQLMGSSVDRRTDVFALGCVLYEITVGIKPFQGDHDPQVMASIMLGRYDLPSALAQGFPPELEAIVVRALGSEPDHRFATAEHMLRALEGYLQASGPPVTHHHVAALVRERCGAEVDARARVLGPRPATSAPPARRGGPTETGSGAKEIDRPPAAARGAYAWLAVAVLVGAALGAGVLAYARNLHKARLAARGATEHVVAAAPPSAGAAPATIALDAAPAPTAKTVVGVVRLRVAPSTASLVVDGVPLVRGDGNVARPTDGGTVTVVVHAEKHDDTIVLVDSATPDDLDVTLVPTTTPPRRAADAAAVRAPKDAGAAARERGERDTPTMPPNPYE
jgi:serine/threonine-protein kinase